MKGLVFCFFVVSITKVFASSSEVKLIRDQKCPERAVFKEQVDLKKLSGLWYVLYDYKDSRGTFNFCDCTMYILQFSDNWNDFYARGCCREVSNNLDHCQSIPRRSIYKTTPFDKKDGEREYGQIFDNRTLYDYTTLDTDYEKFAVLYSCRNLENGQSEEQIRIGAKEPYFDAETEEKVNSIIDQYFDRSLLRKIEQDETKCQGVKQLLEESQAAAMARLHRVTKNC